MLIGRDRLHKSARACAGMETSVPDPATAPKKRLYRSRAHSNPLNDQHFQVPARPDAYDWSQHYPAAAKPATDVARQSPRVEFADVGCGFGGLLIQLSTRYPDNLILGMEIRDKVTEYVKERIAALRTEHPGQYTNISCLRTNAQKYLPYYFNKGQLTKLFFLFPDPHFKKSNHRRRIISASLLSEYAYCMAIGGIIYTITDVPEVGVWMRDKLAAHPCFEPVPEEEVKSDPAAQLLVQATEEGQKVARNSGQTWQAIYRRVAVS